jgi:membrane-associated phospholipid phosphatase
LRLRRYRFWMRRSVKAPLFAAIACAAAIAPLAVAAYGFGPVKSVDLRILLHLERETGPAHDLAMALVVLGDLAALLVLVAAVCALGLHFGRRREVVAAVIVVAGANLTTQLLKVTLEHARHKAFEHGIELPWPNSFPSGHTTAAASIAVALLLVVPARHRLRAAAVGFLLTAAVGISVVVLAWHYPSDVLGGLLVVATWGFAALAALRLRPGRDGAVSGARSRPSGTWAVSTN